MLLAVTFGLTVAAFTVSELLPLLARKFESPTKLALKPPAYVLVLIPDRLTLDSVATPLAFVVAVPALVPLSAKLMVLPLTAEPSEVLARVAERLTVPP